MTFKQCERCPYKETFSENNMIGSLCRSCYNEINADKYNYYKLKIFNILGNKCCCCNNTNIEKLLLIKIELNRDLIIKNDTRKKYLQILKDPLILNKFVLLCNNNKCYYKYNMYCFNCNDILSTLNWSCRHRNNNIKICINCSEQYYSKLKNLTIKLATIKAYGGRCVDCGETNIGFLTLDHIYNNGAIDRKNKILMSGTSGYEKLCKLGFPKNELQILCYNCNYKKALVKNTKSINTTSKLINGNIFYSEKEMNNFKQQATKILLNINDYLMNNAENLTYVPWHSKIKKKRD